jgi:hypothetical protein
VRPGVVTGPEERADIEGDALPSGEEPPPVLGRWRNLYALVLLELAIVIALLWFFTRRFA